MTGVVLHRVCDQDLLDKLRAAVGPDLPLRAWDDMVGTGGDLRAALRDVDALLIDSQCVDPGPLSNRLRRHGVEVPIIVIRPPEDALGVKPKGPTSFLPDGNFVVASRTDPAAIAGHLSEQIARARRRAAVNMVFRRELDQLAAGDKKRLFPRQQVVDQLFEYAPIGIVLINDDGRVAFANQYASTLFCAGESALIGADLRQLIPGMHGRRLARTPQIGATPDESPMDICIGDDTMRSRYVSVRVVPLAGYDDWATRLMIMEDNTEKVMARDAAEEATRAKSEFLASMSHELRTPLNAIIGFAEVMTESMFGSLTPKYKEYCSDIHTSALHLLDVINDTLDMAKIEANGFVPVEEEITVGEALENCIKFVKAHGESKGLSLDLDVPAQGLRFRSDPRLVRQIVINLLTNAVKYTDKNGHIRIDASALKDGGIEVRVSDTGIGIAEADIPKVLEPFGQARSSPQIFREGTGLGLPLSKQLTELLGGSFTIESRVGCGTTITLSFPPALPLGH